MMVSSQRAQQNSAVDSATTRPALLSIDTAAAADAGPDMGSLMETATLSIVMRFHAGADAALLDEALFSLSLQEYDDLELILAVQNPSPELLAKIERLVADQPWRSAPAVQLLPIEIPPGVDGRSELMNRGIFVSRGRYLAFLDYDDVVYRDAYTRLIERLQSQGSTWAVGGCLKSNSARTDQGWYVHEKYLPDYQSSVSLLCWGCVIPIHSYVIDRARLDDFALGFELSLTRHEDYDFLLRLAHRHAPDLTLATEAMCEYRVRLDGSNTILDFQQSPSPEKQREWDRCTAIIEQRKRELIFKFTAAELAELHRTRIDSQAHLAGARGIIAEQLQHIDKQTCALRENVTVIDRQRDEIIQLHQRVAQLSEALEQYRRCVPRGLVTAGRGVRFAVRRIVGAVRAVRRHVGWSSDASIAGSSRARRATEEDSIANRSAS